MLLPLVNDNPRVDVVLNGSNSRFILKHAEDNASDFRMREEKEKHVSEHAWKLEYFSILYLAL